MNTPRQHRPTPPSGQRRPDRRAPERAAARAVSAGSGDASRWLPLGAAGLLLAGIVGFGVFGGDDSSDAAAGTTLATLPAPSVTEAPAPTPAPSTTTPKVPLSQTLASGMSGTEVEMVQQRLADVGIDPGPIDGVFGAYTEQAVWAFEKMVLGTPRQQVTGQVTPELWDRLQEPLGIQPRRPQGTGRHLEIYLPEQVSIFFEDDQPTLIAHSSSGELDENGEPKFYEERATWTVDANGVPYDEPLTGIASAYAKTPAGVFEVHRKETGNHVSPLGGMTNPVYFNYGIAIHGAYNVPTEPASHGCVRVNQYLATYFQNLIDFGDTVYVWGYDGREPEEYSEADSAPYWDRRTYDTTVPPTTLPPTTEPTTTTSTTTSTSTTTTTSTSTTTTSPTTTSVASDASGSTP